MPRSTSSPSTRTAKRTWLELAILAALFIAVFLIYGQVDHFEFSSYDDPEYVSENTHIHDGLTLGTIEWAATAVVVGNWTPVTMLSHAFDTQLGLESGGRHLMNVLIHALAALLLFAALRRATQATWASAFVAAMFALHPVHVESVAWIAERKDVLSAFWGFAALYAYVRYAKQPGVRRYLMVAGALALGLMSKPMLVTFPFVFLLFDVWPLRRRQFPKVLVEKLPLFALSAADAVVTYLVQHSIGAVQAIPLLFRVRNALVGCVIYIGQLFWPVNLTVFYPIHAVAVWQVMGAAAVVLAVSALAIRWWRVRPWFATGWFWFLGTLVPVIGLVQVGAQAHADRYTYIPLVGLSIMLAWGVQEFGGLTSNVKAAAAIAGCLACMALTSRQASYWENDGTLFQHAVDVTENNFTAENGLALYLAKTGRPAEAIPHFEAYLRMVPNDAQIHNNLGILYGGSGGHEKDAIAQFEAAVRIEPNFKEAQYNLGLALSKMPGRTADAIAHLEAARRIEPSPSITQLIESLKGKQ